MFSPVNTDRWVWTTHQTYIRSAEIDWLEMLVSSLTRRPLTFCQIKNECDAMPQTSSENGLLRRIGERVANWERSFRTDFSGCSGATLQAVNIATTKFFGFCLSFDCLELRWCPNSQLGIFVGRQGKICLRSTCACWSLVCYDETALGLIAISCWCWKLQHTQTPALLLCTATADIVAAVAILSACAHDVYTIIFPSASTAITSWHVVLNTTWLLIILQTSHGMVLTLQGIKLGEVCHGPGEQTRNMVCLQFNSCGLRTHWTPLESSPAEAFAGWVSL